MATTAYKIGTYPKDVSLRDGSTVKLRTPEHSDAGPLLEFFLGIPDVERYYLKDDVTSPSLIARWVQELDYSRALPLVALVNGTIVAEAVLIRRRGNARSHVGDVRVVVAPTIGTGAWAR